MAAFSFSYSKLLQEETTTSTSSPSLSSVKTMDEESAGLLLADTCIRHVKKVNRAAKTEQGLRVQVDGGGCSGFRYEFAFTTDINEDDIVIEKNGVKVVVDEVSLDFIKGSTLSYNEDIFKSSFSLVNPNAEEGCSCGSSFNIK